MPSPKTLIAALRKCAYLVGSWESDGIKENNPTERYDLLADKIEKRLLQELSDREICEMDGYMDGYDKGYQDGKEDYDRPKT
jgi:hypothetical protein